MEIEKVKEKAVELLGRMGNAHGAPSREGAVRRVFREELGSGVYTDRTGNIFREKKGSADSPRIMLTAHMDEVGFMVQTITGGGLIKFAPLGGWWGHTLLAQRMRILTEGGTEIIGVVGAKPPHFLSESEREKVMKPDDMFIDVGAVSAEEVRDRFGIRLGDTIVPESTFTRLHNPDYLLCKAFDNRAGMALVVHALQLLEGASHPNVIVGSGTVQEELGTRGARTAAFSLNPDAAIVLEGTPADDLPGTAEDECQGALGRGVQIRIMDPSAVMSRQFNRHALKVAEDNGIRHQTAVRKSGGTDAAPIHLHGAGVPVIVLGVPARYIHTHNSIICLDDYLSALQLVLKLVETLNAKTVESFTAFDD